MVKFAHSASPHLRSASAGKWVVWVALMMLLAGVAILVFSFFSHDAANPACRCILCEFNHVPQDGELVYNRYLPVISMVWVAFMILLVYMMRRYMNKR